MKATTTIKFVIFMVMSLPYVSLFAQLTPFPGSLAIDGQTFNSGTQIFSHPASIISPDNPNNPVSISNTAIVTFQSATEVILKNGFEAGGFTGNGQFLGKINPNLDMVLITPNPATSIINGQVHVPKWEKLEVALKLPQEYQTAIDNFFTNYYTNNVNPLSDLNPYASDSLEVRINLTKPDGVTQLVKYAFFMRPGMFASSADIEPPAIDEASPLAAYPFRFRFAPDVVNGSIPWTFSITISNPQALSGFPTYTYSGFEFICDDPLPDNHGYLNVHTTNNRIFQFDDSTPFFGIGLNIADARHAFNTIGLDWRLFYQFDFNHYINSIEQLSSVGGNYIRTFLFKSSFNPEWEHLGVYDHYDNTPNTCPDGSGWDSLRSGNRQANAWMLDEFIDKCREENVYLQLCIDPYPPIVGYQKFIWGDNCYVREYVYPTSVDDLNNDGYLDAPYLTQEYFVSLLTAFDPDNEGAMYYWKRKYKYIMSRWGYSVNIANFETFNEVNQTLGYYQMDLTGANPSEAKIQIPNDPEYNSGSICNMNQINYTPSSALRDVIWLYHDLIVPYAKDLDDNNHMFGCSYGRYEDPTVDPTYNELFDHPELDFNDAHAYAENYDATTSRHGINQEVFEEFGKPFQFGENSTFAEVEVPNDKPSPAPALKRIGTADFYNNYDDSFHREIWSTSMNGSFSTGLSWFWQTVFWWTGGMPYDFKYGVPPNEVIHAVNNGLGNVNQVTIDGIDVDFTNSTTFHHYKPLSDFLQNLDLNQPYDSKIYTDEPNGIQAIYNMQQTSGIAGYGWLHNYHKYWRTGWVLDATYNYFEENTICSPSGASTYTLSGLISGETYTISYHPTRMSGQTMPNDFTGTALTCGSSGCLAVPVNFTLGCDTTSSDFAFTVTCTSCTPLRLMGNNFTKPKTDLQYSFKVNPNPSRGSTLLTCEVNDGYKCTINDIKGQYVKEFNFTGNNYLIKHSDLKPGVYYLRIQTSTALTYKKLVIQ